MTDAPEEIELVSKESIRSLDEMNVLEIGMVLPVHYDYCQNHVCVW